jgi:hypothetical protein
MVALRLVGAVLKELAAPKASVENTSKQPSKLPPARPSPKTAPQHTNKTQEPLIERIEEIADKAFQMGLIPKESKLWLTTDPKDVSKPDAFISTRDRRVEELKTLMESIKAGILTLSSNPKERQQDANRFRTLKPKEFLDLKKQLDEKNKGLTQDPESPPVRHEKTPPLLRTAQSAFAKCKQNASFTEITPELEKAKKITYALLMKDSALDPGEALFRAFAKVFGANLMNPEHKSAKAYRTAMSTLQGKARS